VGSDKPRATNLQLFVKIIVFCDKILYNAQQHKQVKKIMTPSLANFLWSLFWGAIVVVIPVVTALIILSQSDKIQRG
jgi:photosystem II PsbX protein